MTKWTMVYDDYDVRQVMVILQKLNFVGGPSFNEHAYQVWFHLAPWFSLYESNSSDVIGPISFIFGRMIGHDV
jgi:hypothetical protein